MIFNVSSQLAYAIGVTIIEMILPVSSVDVVAVSQGLSVALMYPLMVVSWRDGLPKPSGAPLQPDADGKTPSLFAAGVNELKGTANELRTKYPEAGRFLVGDIFAEAGVTSLAGIVSTFLYVHMDMRGLIAMVLVFALVFSLPSAIFVNYLMVKKDVAPKKIMLGSLSLYTGTNLVATFVLTGPSMWPFTFILGIFYGFVLGAYYPA